jgi:uncharacterized protein (DUF2147 family)
VKKLFAIAAFLLASTAAQAQYTFEYGGRTIHVDPDRGTVSIPGVYDNSGRRSKRSHADQGSDRQRKQMPRQAKVDPQAPAAEHPPTEQSEPSTTTANAPADNAIPAPPPASAPAQLPQNSTPVAKPAPAPAVATAPTQTPAPPTSAAQAANTPLGVWLTEEKEGKVRIEQCGANLCGYSVDAKSNQNGEQVLINMKPSQDSRWSGRILDPNTGTTYDSTIALKGSDTLRVQGCAFGGMFCGGQTWSRVN